MSPAPLRRHQDVSLQIAHQFYRWLKDHPCKLYEAPFDVRLTTKKQPGDDEITTVVQPDICIVCNKEKLDDRGCLGAPDLVVEVLSPQSLKKDYNDKFQLYQEAGVQEYWLAHPTERWIEIYTPGKQGMYQLFARHEDNAEPIISKLFNQLKLNYDEVFAE